MEKFTIRTTVDITNSNVRHKIDNVDWVFKRNQQRNLDTILQVIGLKTQPMNVEVRLVTITGNVLRPMAPMLFLGESSEPIPINLWLLSFSVERSDALPIDWLVNELHGVPIVPNLNETIVSFPPMFLTKGRFTNTMVTR